MDKTSIAQELNINYSNLVAWLQEQDKSVWEYTYSEEKWSVGQHFLHLVQSSRALKRGLSMPHLLLRWKFGKNNRKNRSFDEVVARYRVKLDAVPPTMVSPFSNNMPSPNEIPMEECLSELKKLNLQINRVLSRKSDKSLDKLLLPHPLMGRMTLREILMWNAYHTKHHADILKEKYRR